MIEEMSIKQQKKKNWIHLAGCDWSQLLTFLEAQYEIRNNIGHTCESGGA